MASYLIPSWSTSFSFGLGLRQVKRCGEKLDFDIFWIFVLLQKTEAEASEEEEEKEEALKPSPDADTVILFTQPTNQGLFTTLCPN